MLIELSIENFRSIRHRQTLSMVAASRLSKKQNTIQPLVIGEKFPSLVRAVAIYGPNASGKSTIVKAFHTLLNLTRLKPSVEKIKLPASPFRFDKSLKESPSKFEIHFIEKKTRYSFEIALTQDRIIEERLTEYVKGSPRLLYERSHLGDHDTYKFGDGLEGGRELHEAWRKLTGPQTLFISQAVANSNEELNQLRSPLHWISNLMIEDSGMEQSTSISRRVVAEIPSFGKEIVELLRDVDVPVSGIKSKIIDTTGSNTPAPEYVSSLSDSSKKILTSLISGSKVETTLTHITSLGEAEFDFDEESEGTKNLLGFALPWFVFSKSPDTVSKILIVDEIDSSLHPKLVEALVQRHLTGELNCQLIFTTHDTHLMDTKLLRRDQFWVTERDETGATQLRSIHDFEGREGEDIEKRYFEGRYRALPVLRRS